MQTTRGASLSDAEAAHRPPDPRGPRRTAVLVAVALLVLAADVVSKVAVVDTLTHGREVRLLDGFLTLVQTRNGGAAFGIAGGATILFTAVAVGVVLVIVRTAPRLRSLPWAVCLGLLLGGAAGNLSDRLFRAPGVLRGHVVDWIQVPHWPVFNLADSAIVIGGVLAVIIASRGLRVDGSRDAR